MTADLFDVPGDTSVNIQRVSAGALWLQRFAVAQAHGLLAEVGQIESAAPFRHLHTPGGLQMSVAMTNCGPLGWVSDAKGYRYSAVDPLSGQAWPAMPKSFLLLAHQAAEAAGFIDFKPDACLINRYLPGTRMSLHQDKDEQDLSAPIVSVSFGLSALFLWGGFQRADKALRLSLKHGDVLVWGGPDRLRYHGILPLQEERGGVLPYRINLTFRKVL